MASFAQMRARASSLVCGTWQGIGTSSPSPVLVGLSLLCCPGEMQSQLFKVLGYQHGPRWHPRPGTSMWPSVAAQVWTSPWPQVAVQTTHSGHPLPAFVSSFSFLHSAQCSASLCLYQTLVHHSGAHGGQAKQRVFHPATSCSSGWCYTVIVGGSSMTLSC